VPAQSPTAEETPGMWGSAEEFDPDRNHARLAAALRDWLGGWPPRTPLDVVGSPRRAEPGWDGRLHPAVGIARTDAMVLSVPPDRVEAVLALSPPGAINRRRLRSGIGRAVGGSPRQRLVEYVFRWSTAPATLADCGIWVPATGVGVPTWLRPFGGEVLVARDGAGRHLGGVGIKRHTPLAHELAVMVAPEARGRGVGRHLVAQAARRILDSGAVPLYMHARANGASGRLAEAAGFPDDGWHMYEVAGDAPRLPVRVARRAVAWPRRRAGRR
jgi:GNAT superfamily N-acetyltransferase